MFTHLVLLLFIINLLGCTSHLREPSPSTVNTVIIPAPTLAIPQPPGRLPLPYAGAEIRPTTAEEQDYANYLWTTKMLPDQVLCESNLAQRLQSVAKPGSSQWTWVTKPFLAWGGIWKQGAVVGPVQYLFSITEAHITWLDLQNQEHKQTFSCYVQYAQQGEAGIWRVGHLRYGSYMNEGHQKYASGPAIPFGVALPDPNAGWEPGIKYYRVE